MTKSNLNPRTLVEWTRELDGLLANPPARQEESLNNRSIGAVQRKLEDATDALRRLSQDLDPIKLPGRVFNPSDPSIVGPFISLALLAQPRQALAGLGRFYGSGIYAIYYTGAFNAYRPISGAEHPIYVGKADPQRPKADNPREQGDKLVCRLEEHRKNISKATNLDIADFDCRYLVISSGWQQSAENFLIKMYEPIWNSETKICFGLGKHGDSSATRANKRSPWDTMHPGRAWAVATHEDQIPEIQIRKKLAEHFRANPPIKTVDDAFQRFLAEYGNTSAP